MPNQLYLNYIKEKISILFTLFLSLTGAKLQKISIFASTLIIKLYKNNQWANL